MATPGVRSKSGTAISGRRIPALDLKYGSREVLPGQVNDRFGWAELEGPGRFRIWTVPGAAYVQTNRIPVEYGWRRVDVEDMYRRAGLTPTRPHRLTVWLRRRLGMRFFFEPGGPSPDPLGR